MDIIAGVDEAGRGPLSGPVFAAAVILDPAHPIEGLVDSKALTEKKRDDLFSLICQKAKAFSVAYATVEEIDRINILQATFLAMKRAIENLSLRPDLALIDGNQVPLLSIPCEAVVKGDQTIAAISAASILAKVSRDRVCYEHDLKYPGYGFAQHKGYGTKQHIEALKKLGACEVHRKSYAPVKKLVTPQIGDYKNVRKHVAMRKHDPEIFCED